jgi:ribosomal-protein-alanine N-acetyltransferase
MRLRFQPIHHHGLLISLSLLLRLVTAAWCAKKRARCWAFSFFSPIKPEAHLLSIAVTKTQQSKGMGSLLIKSMISQCKAMGINQVFLEVRVSNEKAIAFYQKYGFEKDAIRDKYYSGDIPEDALLMSLRL